VEARDRFVKVSSWYLEGSLGLLLSLAWKKYIPESENEWPCKFEAPLCLIPLVKGCNHSCVQQEAIEEPE
jgi:hypothetical protein